MRATITMIIRLIKKHLYNNLLNILDMLVKLQNSHYIIFL